MASCKRPALISVVVPVFNEEQGIAQLYSRLISLRTLWQDVDLEFVLVDDGSCDQSATVLREKFDADRLSQIIVHPRNRGVGAAFRTGFAHCNGSIVCTIDADCSYGPENLERLVEALVEQSADVAVASPYHPWGHVQGVPAWRLALSKACSVVYWLIAPVRLYTYTSIFRAYSKRVTDSLVFEEDGFVFSAETLILAAEQGYKIVEVPLTLHARQIGQTKMKILRTIRGHLRLIAATAMRRTGLLRPTQVAGDRTRSASPISEK